MEATGVTNHKRHLEDILDEISREHASDRTLSEGQHGEVRHRDKRSRADFASESGTSPVQTSYADNGIKYVTVHQVLCSQHAKHPASSFYYDVPRLFTHDNKRSALRGCHEIIYDDEEEEEEDDLDDPRAKFMDNHPDVSFVVVLQYSCEQYHEMLGPSMVQLQLPVLARTVRAQLEPLFSVLEEDGPLAQPYARGISIMSHVLWEATEQIKTNMPRHFRRVELIRTRHFDLHIASYDDFYHIKLSMDKIRSSTPRVAVDGWRHFNALCQIIFDASQQDFDAANTLFERGIVTRRHLSKLFGPDEIIVDGKADPARAFMVDEAVWASKEQEGFELIVKYWSWDHNGVFVRCDMTCTVRAPHLAIDAEMPLQALRLYPLKYDKSTLNAQLLKRGHRFWACRRRKFVSYILDSPILTTMPRFMIDIDMYQRMHPRETEKEQRQPGLYSGMALPANRSVQNQGSFIGTNDNLDSTRVLDIPDGEGPPDYPFLLLCPHTIRGYGFHDKKWRVLEVDNIRDVSWNTEAFDRHLVLKQQKKELLKALITVHLRTQDSGQNDIIEGKGKGMIILLHGSPGTGKTLTAESIAEFTERPLYRVTCGDIGTDPETVEKYLETVLLIGTVWKCVVLLDEADVFLEERGPGDLQRNALVSCFLRVLEYFEGILILTSNRVTTFDEAFKSRVQLALHYPRLDERGRWEVWNMFLRTLLREQLPVDYDGLKAKLDVLSRHKLNGRQIRNTLNTARQLARYKGETLTYAHLDQAIDVLNEFERYVESSQGYTDDEFARATDKRSCLK